MKRVNPPLAELLFPIDYHRLLLALSWFFPASGEKWLAEASQDLDMIWRFLISCS
jgi:hypothetical protein